MKQIKRINLTFLCSVILGIIEMCLVSVLALNNIHLGIVPSLILSQATIVIPGLVFLIIGRESLGEQIPFRKIKYTSVLMVILFIELCMPLVTVVNLFSQLFASNAAAELSSELVDVPLALNLFIVGFFGPFCEEMFFRGVIFNGLKRNSNRVILPCIISALFFGIMHMNINQCAYAILLGIVFAFINAALDSIWPSIICHITINTQNVYLAYSVEKLAKVAINDNKSIAEAANSISKSSLLISGIFILVLSVFTTVFAVLLFVGICNNEGKYENMMRILGELKRRNSSKDRDIEGNPDIEKSEAKHKLPILTVSGYIAIVICVYIMLLIEPTVKLVKSIMR